MQSTVWDEAVKLQAADNDYHRRDLFEAIDAGDFPEWELGIQAFDEKFAAAQPYDVLDPTKIIPEEVMPVRLIGRMVLDRNPDNFFAETEQVAFCPANIVPGIDFTNDPLLQGRLFSYLDTQKSRLGTANFHQLPINAPKCPVMNFQRDGHMQMKVPKGRANYEPNSLAVAGEEGGAARKPEHWVSARSTGRTPRATRPATSCASAPNCSPIITARRGCSGIRSLTETSRRISPRPSPSSCRRSLSTMSASGWSAISATSTRSSPSGSPTRSAWRLPAKNPAAREPIDMKPSPALSIVGNMKDMLDGRVVGILFADGSDGAAIDKVKAAVEKAGGSVKLVAPKVGGAKLADGKVRKADGQLAGTPSVVFDAVALVLSAEGAAKLAKEGAAVQFVMDAFGHLKAIGASRRRARPCSTRPGSRRTRASPGSAASSSRPRPSASSSASPRCGRWPERKRAEPRGPALIS